jgi:putative FmdB family regulatory protein
VPTYEYACESCGHRYEKREGFDAKPQQKCPKCGKNANRVLFAPPVVFKGSGFYRTDSRPGSSDGATASDTPSVPDPGSAGHGHAHGPGSHTHDTPASTPSTSTGAEAAAAG